MSNNQSKETSLATQLIAGTKKHFSTASSLAFGGGTYTPAQIESSLQTVLDLLSAVNVAKAATKAKLAVWNTQAPSLRSIMSAYETFVKATFGNSPDVLADFGLKPRKARAPLTIQEMAAAAAKRTATRAARHTMGTAQKKAVKGTITTIVTGTPATATPPVVTGGGGASVPAPAAASATPATTHVTTPA